jgi:hypothetical protein
MSKTQVTDRMKCKLYDDEDECLNVEEYRCVLLGETTAAYEDCMINLNNLLGNNATQFCVDHYSNLDNWVNTLSPKYVLYHQRKHSCYETSGVPKGKEFCDDMKLYNQGWSNSNLFNCYRSNGVDFSKQFCDDKFDISTGLKSTEENLLRCYADKGIEKGKIFCDLNNKNNDTETVQARIACYDSLPILSKDVCDTKANYDSTSAEITWSPINSTIWLLAGETQLIDDLKVCYKSLGYENLDE